MTKNHHPIETVINAIQNQRLYLEMKYKIYRIYFTNRKTKCIFVTVIYTKTITKNIRYIEIEKTFYIEIEKTIYIEFQKTHLTDFTVSSRIVSVPLLSITRTTESPTLNSCSILEDQRFPQESSKNVIPSAILQTVASLSYVDSMKPNAESRRKAPAETTTNLINLFILFIVNLPK